MRRSVFSCKAVVGSPSLPPLTFLGGGNTATGSGTPLWPSLTSKLHYHQRPIFPRTLNRSLLSPASARSKLARMSSHVVEADGAQKAVKFPLSPTAALFIQKGDITKWSADGISDAIVNPANERMLGGGGADGAIHRAAGPELVEACFKVPEVRPGIRCPTGEARITPGFKLPVSYVIHTVGPIYDSDSNPKVPLGNAYRNSLTVAKENNIRCIAFPAISCGVYGYPYDEAATVAISTVKEFPDGLKEIHFVLFSDDIYSVWLSTAKKLLEK